MTQPAGRDALRAELRRRRENAGLTQAALARRTSYSRPYVTQVEVGREAGSPEFWQAVDAALDAGGALTLPAAAVPPPRAATVDVGGAAAKLALSPHEWLVVPPRPLLAAVEGDGVSSHLIVMFRQTIDHLRRVDDEDGAGLLLEAAEQQFRWIQTVIEGATYNAASGRVLTGLFGEIAELCGWLAADAGQPLKSRRYHDIALGISHAGGDRELGAYTLAMTALAEMIGGNPWEALLLTRTAEHGLGAAGNPRTRAMIAAWESHAHAALGDRPAFERRLSDAARLYESAPSVEDGPEWLYWLVHPETMAETGRAWVHAGEPARGIATLREGVARTADDFPRDVAIHLAYAGEGLLALGEVDEAADMADRARDATRGIHSARASSLVDQLVTRTRQRLSGPQAGT